MQVLDLVSRRPGASWWRQSLRASFVPSVFVVLPALLPRAHALELPNVYKAGSVHAAAVLPDGSRIVLGSFSAADETPVEDHGVGLYHIAKIATNGELDPSFSAEPVSCKAIAAAPDGSSVYLAACAYGKLLKLDAQTGTTVPSWQPVLGFNQQVSAVAVGADGMVYLGGNITSLDGQNFQGLARVSSAGIVDAQWAPVVVGEIRAMALDHAANRLYIGGKNVSMQPVGNHAGIVRIDLAGAPVADPSWQVVLAGSAEEIVVDATGAVFVGSADSVNGTPTPGIAKIHPAGQVDPAWAPPPIPAPVAMAIAGNHMYVAGSFVRVTEPAFGQVTTFNLARLDAGSGALDVAWKPEPSAPVRVLLGLQGGGLDAYGDFARMGIQPALSAASFDQNGVLTFALPHFEAAGTVKDLVKEPDGAVLVVGDFDKAGEVFTPGMFRLKLDGTLDPDFMPPQCDGTMWAAAIDPAGESIYVAGSFVWMEQLKRTGIAKLDPSGELDPGWAPAIVNSGLFPSSGKVLAVDVDATGRVYVGGEFYRVSGALRSNIARILPDGSADSWNPGANGRVDRLELDEAESLLAVGNFSALAFHPRNHAGRILQNGSLDLDWLPGADWWKVHALASIDGRVAISGRIGVDNVSALTYAQGDIEVGLSVSDGPVLAMTSAYPGAVYLGGHFAVLNNTQKFGVARIAENPDGSVVVEPWMHDVLFDGVESGAVNDLLEFGDDHLLLGGKFPQLGGSVSNGLAALPHRFYTTTSLTRVGPAETRLGESFTVKASVSSSAGQPSGEITIHDLYPGGSGQGTSCTKPVDGGEEIECVFVATHTGEHSIHASFESDRPRFVSGGSAALFQEVVDPRPVNVVFESFMPSTGRVGEPVTVSISVARVDNGSPVAGGKIAVSNDVTQLCPAVLLVNGTGSCKFTPASAGQIPLHASFEPTSIHYLPGAATASFSARFTTTVAVVSHSPDPSPSGSPVAVTVAVDSLAAGGATGTVVVESDLVSCMAALSGGEAKCAIPGTLPPGVHPITARYLGDELHEPNQSMPVAHIVTSLPIGIFLDGFE